MLIRQNINAKKCGAAIWHKKLDSINIECYYWLEYKRGGVNMDEIFKLPVSSYDEIIKIIKAYGNGKVGVAVSLDALVKASGISKFVLSKNNGFLIQMGLITKGSKKAPTDICKKLANAYMTNLQGQIEEIWRQLVGKDDFFNKMLSVVGIKNSISKDEYISHIVYSANCGNSSNYRTGAVTLIEIMKMLSLIEERDGTLVLGEIRNGNIQSNDESRDLTNQPITVVENESILSDQKVIETSPSFFIQQYTCESGQIAKIIIPENATEDDLLGFKEMLDITLRRKFKLTMQ